MMQPEKKAAVCELCGSADDKLSFHHLIPQSLHTRPYFKKHYKKSYLKSHGIWICAFYCHPEIHKLITEKDMGKAHFTKELLMEHPLVKSYLKWRSQRLNK